MANYSAESLFPLPSTAPVLLVDKKSHISSRHYGSDFPAGGTGSPHRWDSLIICDEHISCSPIHPETYASCSSPWRLTWNAHWGSAAPFSCLQTCPPAAAQPAVERRDTLVLQLSVQVLVPWGQVSKRQRRLLGGIDFKLLLAERRGVKLMQRCFSVSKNIG